MTSWNKERMDAYRIVRAWECSSKTLHRIWNRFKPPGNFWDALPESISDLTKTQQKALRQSQLESIETDLELMEKQGIRFVLPWEEAFPKSLLQIPDPPAALFIRGAPMSDAVRVAIVGTRRMTAYG
ncbi:hypothetical protein GF380_01270, partial [Candidatus Uhrbacteria bacterium]|nr:hypothetical protein [Candidatus Uhrbacteria bacterium]MBD3283915.1 hypothetical protein [Candidatus Uhrbacteria bacterium]